MGRPGLLGPARGPSLFTAVDPFTGDTVPIVQILGTRPSVAASPSPAGDQLVATDAHGHLWVLGDDDHEPVENEVLGSLPSWSPSGALVFLGGAIQGADGHDPRTLVVRAPESVGTWSPDGSRLAVAARRGLYLFGGFPAATPGEAPVEAKLDLLGDLLLDRLVDEADYRARRDAILGRNP